jgi:hypothetical protein
MRLGYISKQLMTACLLASGTWAFAGDNGGGRIECTSASGRTLVSGSAGVAYNGEGPAQILYSLDKASVELNAARVVAAGVHLVDFVQYDHGKSYIVMIKKSQATYSHRDDSYVNNQTVFELRSLGKWQKLEADIFRFKALIPAYTTIDPRIQPDLLEETQNFDRDIQVTCTLDVTV